MYKRRDGQVSVLENPEMFGSLPLEPNNKWKNNKHDEAHDPGGNCADDTKYD